MLLVQSIPSAALCAAPLQDKIAATGSSAAANRQKGTGAPSRGKEAGATPTTRAKEPSFVARVAFAPSRWRQTRRARAIRVALPVSVDLQSRTLLRTPPSDVVGPTRLGSCASNSQRGTLVSPTSRAAPGCTAVWTTSAQKSFPGRQAASATLSVDRVGASRAVLTVSVNAKLTPWPNLR